MSEPSAAFAGWSASTNRKLRRQRLSYNEAMSALPSKLSSVGNDPQEKLLSLRASLRGMGRLLVAYSGGVDSAFLAWVASRELTANMMAVLADSPSLARSQMRDAVSFADEQQIP